LGGGRRRRGGGQGKSRKRIFLWRGWPFGSKPGRKRRYWGGPMFGAPGRKKGKDCNLNEEKGGGERN